LINVQIFLVQALSLIKNGKKVILFGFDESRLSSEIKNSKNLEIVNFKTFRLLSIKSQILRYIFKSILQFISILYFYIRQGLFIIHVLFKHYNNVSCYYKLKKANKSGYPSSILVQNPPSIPTLISTWLFTAATDSKFIIDWHNYGFSIMNIQNQNKLIVKVHLICIDYLKPNYICRLPKYTKSV